MSASKRSQVALIEITVQAPQSEAELAAMRRSVERGAATLRRPGWTKLPRSSVWNPAYIHRADRGNKMRPAATTFHKRLHASSCMLVSLRP